VFRHVISPFSVSLYDPRTIETLSLPRCARLSVAINSLLPSDWHPLLYLLITKSLSLGGFTHLVFCAPFARSVLKVFFVPPGPSRACRKSLFAPFRDLSPLFSASGKVFAFCCAASRATCGGGAWQPFWPCPPRRFRASISVFCRLVLSPPPFAPVPFQGALTTGIKFALCYFKNFPHEVLPCFC